MPISQAITDFAGALDAARAELAEVNGKISALEIEHFRVATAPPHTDDIIAVFMSGIQKVEKDFEEQFNSFLNSAYTGREAAARTGEKSSATIIDRRLAEQTQHEPHIISKDGRPQLNVAAVAYFLRGQIAAEIPALVERLCPSASRGMKAADRDQQLRELDAQLSELRTQRDALQADLQAARQAVR